MGEWSACRRYYPRWDSLLDREVDQIAAVGLNAWEQRIQVQQRGQWISKYDEEQRLGKGVFAGPPDPFIPSSEIM